MLEPNRETLAVNGLKVACTVHGDGPAAILALHGWGGGVESFWPVALQLNRSGRYSIHLLDLPGFGGSDLPPGAWDVPAYAAFVAAYLEVRGLERAHVLGHSFGGRIGLVLGADYAGRVDRLVLANSAGVPNPPTPVRDAIVKAGKAILRLPGLRRLYEPARRRAYERFGATDYLEAGPLRETFLRVVGQDLLPHAARISRPTLLIWGDQDRDTPLWQGHRLEQTIPGAGLVVFEGAGHFSYLERLPEYVRIVDHFLTVGSGEMA